MIERDQSTGSPLRSDRGRTIIDDTVVSRIAGMAAEVDGIYLGGSTARTAGDFIDRIRGSQSETRGISVEVGQEEAAIDLTVGTEYGRNIVEVTEAVRRTIVERVETITGLRVTEMNITIDDIIFPSEEERERREREARSTTNSYSGSAAAEEHESTGAAETQEQTSQESRTGPEAEEETRTETTEETAVAEDETAEINLQGEEIDKRPDSGEDEGGRRREE